MQMFDAPFGKIQVFGSDEKFGSSILLVGPGKEIIKHHHKKTKEIEVILEGEITCGDKIQKSGDINIWEIDQSHGYRNESGTTVKILCITVPPYDPKDVFEA